jgi:hypothetical protein
MRLCSLATGSVSQNKVRNNETERKNHTQPLISIVTCKGLAGLIIMDYRFDDWVNWHFFTIKINYNRSQSMAP